MGNSLHATTTNVSGGRRRNILTCHGKRSPIEYLSGFRRRCQHEERLTQLPPLAWGSRPRGLVTPTPAHVEHSGGRVPVRTVTSAIASTDAATVGTSTTASSSAVKSIKRALNHCRQTPSLGKLSPLHSGRLSQLLDGYDEDLPTHLTHGY